MAYLSHLLVPDRNRPTVYTLGFEKYGQQEVHTLAKGHMASNNLFRGRAMCCSFLTSVLYRVLPQIKKRTKLAPS